MSACNRWTGDSNLKHHFTSPRFAVLYFPLISVLVSTVSCSTGIYRTIILPLFLKYTLYLPNLYLYLLNVFSLTAIFCIILYIFCIKDVFNRMTLIIFWLSFISRYGFNIKYFKEENVFFFPCIKMIMLLRDIFNSI